MSFRKKSPRFGRTKSLAQCADYCVTPLSKKQGFIMAAFVLDWEKIVGPDLAKITQIANLNLGRFDGGRNGGHDGGQNPYQNNKPGGKLSLIVQSGAALMVNFQKDIIIQRANQYFGYTAISTLHIKQDYIQNHPKNNKAKITTPPHKNCGVDGIENQDLQNALNNLGRWIV